MDDSSCLEICKVFGKQYPELIPEKYLNVADAIGLNTKTNKVPWEMFVGKETFASLKQQQTQKFDLVLNEIGTDIWYYNNIYSKTKEVFDYLQPAKINVPQFKLWIDKNPDTLPESWLPNKQGYLEIPKYTLCDSITGRMTIKSGPNILLLPKELRTQLLTSRHGINGSLWYIDFVSLEPRVALVLKNLGAQNQLDSSSSVPLIGYLPLPTISKENNQLAFSNLPVDIYALALRELKLSQTITREILKQIVLPQIYGQSKANTIENLEKNKIHRPEEVVDMVNDFFGIDTIRHMLFLELQKNGYKFIRTFYGRHVCPEDSKPYRLFNYWVQSLSVDIALLGFRNIVKKIHTVPGLKDYVTPIFFIHDAMILDIHKDFEHIVSKLCNVGSQNIFGLEHQTFFLSGNKL